MTEKAWGGRFQGEAIEWVDEFNASIHFDNTLIEMDIAGSIAHAAMLAKQGIITDDEQEEITDGLKAVLEDYKNGITEFSVAREDIHMNVEHALDRKSTRLNSSHVSISY